MDIVKSNYTAETTAQLRIAALEAVSRVYTGNIADSEYILQKADAF